PRRTHDLRAEVDGGRAHEAEVACRVANAVQLRCLAMDAAQVGGALSLGGLERLALAIGPAVGAEVNRHEVAERFDRGRHRSASSASCCARHHSETNLSGFVPLASRTSRT